ncbi:MAG: hypothetical protein V1787_00265 [Candidatus Micrarchaeota archaeon]
MERARPPHEGRAREYLPEERVIVLENRDGRKAAVCVGERHAFVVLPRDSFKGIKEAAAAELAGLIQLREDAMHVRGKGMVDVRERFANTGLPGSGVLYFGGGGILRTISGKTHFALGLDLRHSNKMLTWELLERSSGNKKVDERDVEIAGRKVGSAVRGGSDVLLSFLARQLPGWGVTKVTVSANPEGREELLKTLARRVYGGDGRFRRTTSQRETYDIRTYKRALADKSVLFHHEDWEDHVVPLCSRAKLHAPVPIAEVARHLRDLRLSRNYKPGEWELERELGQ